MRTRTPRPPSRHFATAQYVGDYYFYYFHCHNHLFHLYDYYDYDSSSLHITQALMYAVRSSESARVEADAKRSHSPTQTPSPCVPGTHTLRPTTAPHIKIPATTSALKTTIIDYHCYYHHYYYCWNDYDNQEMMMMMKVECIVERHWPLSVSALDRRPPALCEDSQL